MLGNLSKYFRAQPSLGALYHLAYIPSASTRPHFKLWFRYLPVIFSCLIHSRISFRHFIANGGLKSNLLSHIAVASSCMAPGVYYLMTISSTHVPTESSSCASMELSDGSTQGFLHIRLIIQKSLFYFYPSWFTYSFYQLGFHWRQSETMDFFPVLDVWYQRQLYINSAVLVTSRCA